jgi:hypothetical protein
VLIFSHFSSLFYFIAFEAICRNLQYFSKEKTLKSSFPLSFWYPANACHSNNSKIFDYNFENSPVQVQECWDMGEAFEFICSSDFKENISYLFHFQKPNHKGFDGFLLLKEARTGKFWILCFELKFSENISSTTVVPKKIGFWNECVQVYVDKAAKSSKPIPFPTSLDQTLLAFVTFRPEINLGAKDESKPNHRVFALDANRLYPAFLNSRPQFYWSQFLQNAKDEKKA